MTCTRTRRSTRSSPRTREPPDGFSSGPRDRPKLPTHTRTTPAAGTVRHGQRFPNHSRLAHETNSPSEAFREAHVSVHRLVGRGQGLLVRVRARSLQRGGRMCVGGYRAFLVYLRVTARSLVSAGRVSDGGGAREGTSSWRLIDHDGSAVV